MSDNDLSSTTNETLLIRFENLCLQQHRSLEREEIEMYNSRYYVIESIIAELKRRSGDQRILLRKFYKHRNLQVALTAATATLAIDYSMARRTIEEIAESDVFPQAGDAGMGLLHLDRGVFRPT